MPNVPDYTAPVKSIGQPGLTADLNEAYGQIADLTDWANAAAPTAAPLTLVNDDTQIPAASYVAALNAPELSNFTLLRLNSSYQEFGGVQPPDKRYAVLDGQQGELYTGTNFYLFAPRLITAIRLSSTTVRANPAFAESFIQYSELANSKIDPNGKTVVLLNVQVTGSAFTQGDTDWTTGTGTIIVRGDSAVHPARTESSGVTVQYQQGSDGGETFDPRDVPAAKRQAVVVADAPAVLETDETYYGCYFFDEVNEPGSVTRYECAPSAQADGSTVWKWFRQPAL